MNGKAPVAIPTTFENTKFPSVAEKIKNLVTSREEAVAAHELARSCMAERIRSNFVPFKKEQMVWLDSKHLLDYVICHMTVGSIRKCIRYRLT
jgi:hypothetical protein